MFVFVDNNICYKRHNNGSGSFLCGKDRKIESILDKLSKLYTTKKFNITYDNNYTNVGNFFPGDNVYEDY